MDDGTRADGGQKLLRVFCEENERGMVGWLFEQLEKAVCSFFHEG